MKRISAIVLSVLLCVSLFPVAGAVDLSSSISSVSDEFSFVSVVSPDGVERIYSLEPSPIMTLANVPLTSLYMSSMFVNHPQGGQLIYFDYVGGMQIQSSWITAGQLGFVAMPTTSSAYVQGFLDNFSYQSGLAIPCKAGDTVTLNNIYPARMPTTGQTTLFNGTGYTFLGANSQPSARPRYSVYTSSSTRPTVNSKPLFYGDVDGSFGNYSISFDVPSSVTTSYVWVTTYYEDAPLMKEDYVSGQNILTYAEGISWRNPLVDVSVMPEWFGPLASILDSIRDAVTTPSTFDKLVDSWNDDFSGQMNQVLDQLSPSNPALPNGGDIGGFVSEISDGLGIQGSSFSGTEFNSATSGFTGSNSTGIGGPWEFFTQGVADDLSGDSPAGIDADYDPILSWVEDSERWLKSWGSYNP